MNRRTDIIKALQINWVLSRRTERGLSHSSRALYDSGVPLADAIRTLTSFDRCDPQRLKLQP
jgi:hypothetical protein